MIVIGILLLVAWIYFLNQGEIRFMSMRIERSAQPQRYWVILGCVLALGLFCIWVQLPTLMNALNPPPAAPPAEGAP